MWVLEAMYTIILIIVKPWWKKVWQIMTVERLAEKHWQTEVHLAT